MFNVANSLVLPQWGQTAGQNIRENRLESQALERQNRLGALLPAAYAGDQNALAQLAPISPQAYGQVQSQNFERGRIEKADALTAAVATREQTLATAKWAAGMIAAAQTREAKDAAYRIARPSLTALGGPFAGIPEAYDDSVEATANSILERFPDVPKAPARELSSKMEELRANGIDPNSPQGQKYLGMHVSPAGEGGGTPYYNFLPGDDGYLVGNARTGQITQGMVNGQRAIPGALSPDLQGSLTRAKKIGEGEGEMATDTAKKVRSSQSTLSLLDEADGLIGMATGSGAGQRRDAIAGFFGESTTGADTIGRLQVIGAALTANVPRMEGPQSDADRIMYQQAAGDLGNPATPASRKKAAADTIRTLNQKYIALNGGARSGATGQWSDQRPQKITNDADFDALPSGATFIAPDGSQRRKP